MSSPPVLKGNSREHLNFFLRKIAAREPFGIIRPADGEYLVLKNQTLTNCDNWTFKSGGKVSDDLRTAVCENIPELYVGISCQGCDKTIYNYMKDLIPNHGRITYANIFCNRNWRHFIDFMKTQEFQYIGPGTAPAPEFKVTARLWTDPHLIEWWDSEGEEFLSKVDAFVGGQTGKIFCMSVGPIAKIVVAHCMRKFPQNIYLDCGSSLDMFLKGSTNRSYIDDTQFYTQVVCNFDEPHHTREAYFPAPAATPGTVGDLTVILNMYKRPHVLSEQLAAIRRQTIQPKNIILWVNHVDGIAIPKEIVADKNIHIIYSSKNAGVWGRFTAGILAETEYVCVFDDDTIPGRRWFENCFNTMAVAPGLLGTVGLVFAPGDSYKCAVPRIGWPGPSTDIMQVDIVGHSWFFKREWLSALFSTVPKWPDMFVAGEDIAFSAGLQKIGVPTLVPPHPPGDLDWYGSIPDSAWKYGMEEVGISMNHATCAKFDVCLKYFIARGFITLSNRALADRAAQLDK